MLTIIHGDNTVASRGALTAHVAKARAEGAVVQLTAKDLSIPQLEDALGTQELFSAHTLVVLEGLFALPKSKKKDLMLSMCAGARPDLLVWEAKTLTVTQLKQLPSATIQLFKISPMVFAWLDSLRPGNAAQSLTLLDKAEKQDDIEMCFAMLSRQVRLLLQFLLEPQAVKVAPFALAKRKKQTGYFTVSKLLAIHEKLVSIDEAQKTSASALSLRAQLDLLMYSM